MGRPPIGKQPMTGAERQRRYLGRYLARLLDGKPAAKPAKPDGAAARELAQVKKELAQANARVTEQAAEIARLKARIAELVKAGARKPVTKPVDPDSERAKDKAAITELRARLRYFQKRPEGRIDSRSYTIIRSRMHPDRVSDPEKKARYKIAFEVFGELEKVLVDHEQSRLVREDWDAKFKERDAKLRAKAKKRHPAASPQPTRAIAK